MFEIDIEQCSRAVAGRARKAAARNGSHHEAFLAGALALFLIMPRAGFAEGPASTATPTPSTRSEADPTAPAPEASKPVLSWEPGAGKSYSIPAVEIIGFDFLLNQFDRHFIEADEYGSNFSTFRHNLTHKWVVDNDPFATNQFLHPYQGSMYHGFARSAGLNYWESLGYAFAASVLCETAGETTPPSINDQIASGIGGTFLGEPLFRMASLLLERGGQVPRFWRELGAAVISPPTGFNRLVFGDRCDAVLSSRHLTFNWRLQLGGSWTAHNGVGASQSVTQSGAIFALAYGLPGKPDYSYTRPFDYFNFEFTASSANIFENIMARGLLVGTRYGAGEAYRGVWGLYGSYDYIAYIAPQIFRISSTALSLGTTAQWWLSKTVALQATALAGVGYGAGGTIHGLGERDYHYGLTPQGLLALRLIFGDAASLDLTGRDYYVSRVASTQDRGRESVARAEVSFTWRLYRRHHSQIRCVVPGCALSRPWRQKSGPGNREPALHPSWRHSVRGRRVARLERRRPLTRIGPAASGGRPRHTDTGGALLRYSAPSRCRGVRRLVGMGGKRTSLSSRLGLSQA